MGHFLVNSTARLWPLFSGTEYQDCKLIYFSDTACQTSLSGNYLEFMELAGIADRIIVVDSPVKVDTLFVPDLSLESPYCVSKEFLLPFEAVKAAVIRKPCESPVGEKIYLTRTALKNSKQNEINAQCLDSLFSNNGFTILSPEKMSLTSLIHALINATEIASVSGSLAHNILFGNRLCKYCIIERTAVNNMSSY